MLVFWGRGVGLFPTLFPTIRFVYCLSMPLSIAAGRWLNGATHDVHRTMDPPTSRLHHKLKHLTPKQRERALAILRKLVPANNDEVIQLPAATAKKKPS